MGSFETFCGICYLLGFISLMCLGYVCAFGIPNFDDIDAQRNFCVKNGGYPMEPHRDNYNQMLCVFHYNNTAIDYVSNKITNEVWADAMGVELGSYCFSCWDSRSCASPHNDKLIKAGVHC